MHSGTVFVRLSDADICSILLSEHPDSSKTPCALRLRRSAMLDHHPYRTDGVGITDEFPESFIGRQQELNLLADRYQTELSSGRSRVAWGKSSLLHAFRREMKKGIPKSWC